MTRLEYLPIENEPRIPAPFESMVVYVFSDERPLLGFPGWVDWQLCGFLSRLIYQGKLTGAFLEKILIPGLPRLPIERIFVVGAGEGSSMNLERFRLLLDETWNVFEKTLVCEALLSIPVRDNKAAQDRTEISSYYERFVQHLHRRAFLERVVVSGTVEQQKRMRALYDRSHRQQKGERYSA